MDISSEMVHGLLPIFLVSVSGASTTTLGVLEGVAEATVFGSKMLFDERSDWLGKRKGGVPAGYGMAALTNPLFPLVDSYSVVIRRTAD